VSSARWGSAEAGGGNDEYADTDRNVGERVQPGHVIEHPCEQPGETSGDRETCDAAEQRNPGTLREKASALTSSTRKAGVLLDKALPGILLVLNGIGGC
jgi:hypothetical protein